MNNALLNYEKILFIKGVVTLRLNLSGRRMYTI